MSAGHGTPNQVKYIVAILIIGFVFNFFPVDFYRDLPYFNFNDIENGINNKKRSNYYQVTRVIDGDTLAIDDNGEEKKVRLIGINSPESVDPRRPVQCYGEEASQHMQDLAKGRLIQLEYDDSQGQYDKYGRILAYAYLEDGRMLNQIMIADGYAYEYTYDKPYIYQSKMKTAETIARNSSRGLWSNVTCNGQL